MFVTKSASLDPRGAVLSCLLIAKAADASAVSAAHTSRVFSLLALLLSANSLSHSFNPQFQFAPQIAASDFATQVLMRVCAAQPMAIAEFKRDSTLDQDSKKPLLSLLACLPPISPTVNIIPLDLFDDISADKASSAPARPPLPQKPETRGNLYYSNLLFYHYCFVYVY
jgi:hypothetical protein